MFYRCSCSLWASCARSWSAQRLTGKSKATFKFWSHRQKNIFPCFKQPLQDVDIIDAQVNQSRLTILSKDKEAAQLDQALQLAELETKDITQNLRAICQSIRSFKDKIAQLLQERESLQEELDLSESEIKLLQELKSKETVLKELTSTKPELLHSLITAKEKKIASLTEQLQRVRCRLDEVEAELSDYQGKLLCEIVAELKSKSKEVECLKEAKARTKLELDLERAKVDRLRMQQTMAAEDEERHMCEIEVRLMIKIMCYLVLLSCLIQ